MPWGGEIRKYSPKLAKAAGRIILPISLAAATSGPLESILRPASSSQRVEHQEQSSANSQSTYSIVYAAEFDKPLEQAPVSDEKKDVAALTTAAEKLDTEKFLSFLDGDSYSSFGLRWGVYGEANPLISKSEAEKRLRDVLTDPPPVCLGVYWEGRNIKHPYIVFKEFSYLYHSDKRVSGISIISLQPNHAEMRATISSIQEIPKGREQEIMKKLEPCLRDGEAISKPKIEAAQSNNFSNEDFFKNVALFIDALKKQNINGIAQFLPDTKSSQKLQYLDMSGLRRELKYEDQEKIISSLFDKNLKCLGVRIEEGKPWLIIDSNKQTYIIKFGVIQNKVQVFEIDEVFLVDGPRGVPACPEVELAQQVQPNESVKPEAIQSNEIKPKTPRKVISFAPGITTEVVGGGVSLFTGNTTDHLTNRLVLERGYKGRGVDIVPFSPGGWKYDKGIVTVNSSPCMNSLSSVDERARKLIAFWQFLQRDVGATEIVHVTHSEGGVTTDRAFDIILSESIDIDLSGFRYIAVDGPHLGTNYNTVSFIGQHWPIPMAQDCLTRYTSLPSLRFFDTPTGENLQALWDIRDIARERLRRNNKKLWERGAQVFSVVNLEDCAIDFGSCYWPKLAVQLKVENDPDNYVMLSQRMPEAINIERFFGKRDAFGHMDVFTQEPGQSILTALIGDQYSSRQMSGS